MRALLRLAVLLVLLALPAAAHAAPPPGAFAPERLFAAGHDDWEPAIAADGAGHVYIVTTRFGAAPACGRCPASFMVIRRSSDGGRSFAPGRFLCRCAGAPWQADPQIEVDRRGRVYAVWMNGWHMTFARSDDFGRHWTRPLDLRRGSAWSDKPTLAVSRSGRDVYVVWNGPTSGDPWAVASHDGGRHFTHAHRILSGPRYFYSGGSTVLADGTVLAAQNVYHQDNRGHILMLVLRSADGGRTWTHSAVGRSAEAAPCPPGLGCPADSAFLGEQDAIASDAEGTAYVLWTQAARPRGPARLLLRRSSDGGRTWSRIVAVDGGPGNHEFPMIAAGGAGDVRVAWMDNRSGRWNVWYRRSPDGGRTWWRPLRLSDRAGGAPYKSRAGFGFPYGDYGEIALDGLGRAHVAWGEGPSYTGPGGTWYTRELR